MVRPPLALVDLLWVVAAEAWVVVVEERLPLVLVDQLRVAAVEELEVGP